MAVVGDHEQVSPLGVGQQIEVITALIAEHLDGIPNSHLYDGLTSIFDLARQCFGGAIALGEHVRCVPDIVEFTSRLSCGGEIRPLRDPGTARRPHVVEYVVEPQVWVGRYRIDIVVSDGRAQVAIECDGVRDAAAWADLARRDRW